MNKVVLGILLGGLAVGAVPPGSAQEGAGLRLTGVMMSGQASVAIIAGADGREKAYRLGHEIQPGATLAEVSAHGVVIARDRRREWLPLVGGAGAAGRLAALPPQALPRAPEPTVGMATGTAVAGSHERRPKLNAELARQATTTPAPEGGLQVHEVAPGSAYAAIGLRPGDVLRSVNGAAVDSSKDLNALARQVAGGQPGYAEVVRNGEVSVLRFGQAQ